MHLRHLSTKRQLSSRDYPEETTQTERKYIHTQYLQFFKPYCVLLLCSRDGAVGPSKYTTNMEVLLTVVDAADMYMNKVLCALRAHSFLNCCCSILMSDVHMQSSLLLPRYIELGAFDPT
jgi:hypothetical protein